MREPTREEQQTNHPWIFLFFGLISGSLFFVFFFVYRCILNFILCNDRDLVLFSSIVSGPKSCSPWKKNPSLLCGAEAGQQVLISFEKVGPVLGVCFF